MLTWHHGLWVYFFTRKHAKVWQFVAGAMLPDYVYFIFFGLLMINQGLNWHDITDMNPRVMMSLLPLYPWVVKADLIGHSVVIWSLALMLAAFPLLRGILPFVIGWGSHLLLDAFTHGAYANYYLYPLSMAAVHSTVSYWEPDCFAREFKIVNNILLGTVAVYLIYQWIKSKKRQG